MESKVTKVACVLAPHFRVQVERRSPKAIELAGRPLIILRPSSGRSTVLDCSPEAAGVEPGMPLAEALAHCPNAVLVEHDGPRYAAAFDALLDALEGVSRVVESAPPDAAYVRVDGLELLYGGDEGILRALLASIPPGLSVQAGLANAKFPALLAARSGGSHRRVVLAPAGRQPADVNLFTEETQSTQRGVLLFPSLQTRDAH